jgi:competence protein ComEC
MVGRSFPAPLVAAAAASAAGFYGLLLYPADSARLVAFAAVVAPGLAGSGIAAAASAGRGLRAAGRALIGAGIGLWLGTAAWTAAAAPERPGFAAGAVTSFDAAVAEDPRRLQGGAVFAIVLEHAATPEARASASGSASAIAAGDAAEAVLAAGRGARFRFGGGFAEGAYGRYFRVRTAALLDPPKRLEAWRSALRRGLADRLDGKAWGPLALALLIGDRNELESSAAKAFAAAGCAHVLALSGAHLAVVAALVGVMLLKPLGRRGADLVGLTIIGAYVWLAGGQPALLRSLLMYAAGAAAALRGWPRRLPGLLALGWIAQLALAPATAVGLSCALSYLALVGMAAFGPPLEDLWRSWMPAPASAPLAAAFGAFAGTAALAAGAFGTLRPIGLIAGLAVAPLSSVLMLAALAYLGIGAAWPPLGAALSGAIDLVYRAIQLTVGAAAAAPGWDGLEASGIAGATLAVLGALGYLRYRLETERKSAPRIA